MKKTIFSLLSLTLFSSPLFAQQPPQGAMSPGKFFLMQFDADKNGNVTLQEFIKPTEAQFKDMDKNNDGNVTEQEAEAFANAMRQRMQQMRQQAPQR